MLKCRNDFVCNHDIVVLSADWLQLYFGLVIFPENGGCLILNSTCLCLLKSLVYFQGERIFSFCYTAQSATVLLLTLSAAVFYLLFEQDKHPMLVHLPFHSYRFQNGTWDLTNCISSRPGSTDVCVACYSSISSRHCASKQVPVCVCVCVRPCMCTVTIVAVFMIPV